MRKEPPSVPDHCSFCDKSREEAIKLIVSGSHAICDECVLLCGNLLTEQHNATVKKNRRSQRHINPMKIKQFLDERVIGQELAKMTLSVGVANHFKRLFFKSQVRVEKSNVLLLGPTGSGKTLAYMVPAVFVALAAFPLTPNGKIDRHALPAPAAAAVTETHAYVAATTDTEREIVRIWGEVLALDAAAIGVQHNFFELGGHSLLVVQAMNRLQDAFGIELTVAQLFDRQNVSDLAALVEEQQIAQATGDQLSQILSELGPVSEG